MAVELATAYVSLVPSGKGFGQAVRKEIDGSGLEAAGGAQGKRSGMSFATAFGGALAAAGVVKIFTDVIGEASSLNESISKNTVVFGESSTAVLDFAANADTALGQSKSQALEATGTFGNLLRAVGLTEGESAGMSTTMTALASDLASFNNTSVDEALVALRSGLVGETEPLKRFGVNLNEARLKQEALELGIYSGTGVLDANQKALAANRAIMEDTTLAQGDFARTSDGLANQQKILGAQFDNVKATIGTALLPVVTSFVSFLNENLRPAIEKVGNFLKDNWEPVLGAVAAVIVGTALPALYSMAAGWIAATWPILLAVAALAAIGYGLVWAYKNIEPFRAAVDAVATVVREKFGQALAWVQANWPIWQAALAAAFTWLKDTAGPIVQEVMAKITEAFANVKAWVDANWPAIQQTITSVIDGTRGAIEIALNIIRAIWDAVGQDLINIAQTVWGMIEGVVGGAMKTVQGVVEFVMAVIRGDWGAAWDGIKNIAAGVFDQINAIVRGALSLIGNILQGLGSLLWDLVGGPLENMKGWAQTAVDAVVGFITGIPGRLIGVGAAIAGAISDGLKAAWNTVADSVNNLIPNELGVGFGPSVDIEDNPLPKFHNGGVVPGYPGQEVAIMAMAGEVVVPAGGGSGRGLVVQTVMPDGRVLAEASFPHIRVLEESIR